jgi:hypothetical protein
MVDTDEGSKGGRRSVFGLVAAVLTVLLVLVGVSGRKVTQDTQSNTESPATSGSQNP